MDANKSTICDWLAFGEQHIKIYLYLREFAFICGQQLLYNLRHIFFDKFLIVFSAYDLRAITVKLHPYKILYDAHCYIS